MSAMMIVVMGVAGAGKSTVGQMLAAELHCEFLDGDSLHPSANIEKMTRGIAPIASHGWRPFTPALWTHFNAADAWWSPVPLSNSNTAIPSAAVWQSHGCI